MSYLITQKRKNHYAFFIYLLLFFMVSTIVQRLLPISLNRILAIGIVMAVIFYTYFDRKFSINDIILFLYYGLVLFGILFIAKDKLMYFTDAVYFITTMLFLNFSQDAQILQKLQRTIETLRPVIEIVVVISELILLIALFNKRSYQTAWGGSRYFLGFTEGQHTVASSCCLLMTLVLAGAKGRPTRILDLLFLLLPAVCILASGARTFLVPMLICCYFYFKDHIKSRFAIFLILGIALLISAYLYFHSNMYKKIQYSFSHDPQDLLASLTSGRTDFWIVDLRDFASGSPMQILFGKGFDYIYRLNFAKVEMAIWAHDDFINLLESVGLTGTVIYGIIVIRFLSSAREKISTGLGRCLFAIYILFPMLINGFYPYAHFLYSVVFLIYGVSSAKELSVAQNEPVYACKYFKGAIV